LTAPMNKDSSDGKLPKLVATIAVIGNVLLLASAVLDALGAGEAVVGAVFKAAAGAAVLGVVALMALFARVITRGAEAYIDCLASRREER